jgi:hypothetical protein
MGSCASSNKPEENELPEVDYTSGRPQNILKYIWWDMYEVKHGKYKLKRIKSHKSLKSKFSEHRLGGDVIFKLRHMLPWNFYDMYCETFRIYESVINELHRINYNENNPDYSAHYFPPSPHIYLPCSDMKTKIDKIMSKNDFKCHKKYFIQHVEEELIAYVCHPDNYGKFDALGFYDD